MKKFVSKKILLINPRRETCYVNTPQMGLAILAAILKKKGHKVLVVDYQLIHKAPQVTHFMKKFSPDAIGLSMITANTKESKEIIEQIRSLNKKIPLVVGGPHASLYPEDLENNLDIDYIVRGEAEDIVNSIFENSKREIKPKIIQSDKIVDITKIPYPDYRSFYGKEKIRGYPIMTSRGCPYNCSFCPVAYVSQKKWRARDQEDCIKELEEAKKNLNPNLHILIQDDNALVIKDRFYKFLELYSKRKIGMRLSVLNVRGDDVTEKLVVLLKRTGSESMGVAVESANPEVFKLVNKGETLKDIENAITLLKKHDMLGNLSFVIGLPKDNLEGIKKTIEFVKKHDPPGVFWNMAIPYKNTPMRHWFMKNNGVFYNEIGKTSQRDNDFICEEPTVETKDFTKWERKKAHYMCLFQTTDEKLKLRRLPEIFNEAKKYDELKDFFEWLPRGILKSIKGELELAGKFIAYSKREGFNEAIKRGLFLVRGK
ncbi:MAG: radical SAM protein [Candidatus Pacearchaeota archaeon]|jgi:radical SAM superfamily enzyme YgiQ (UPF0313 family)